jgi:hypothetical protein
MLLNDPAKAMELSRGAQQTANEKFSIERFKNDWLRTLKAVVKRRSEIGYGLNKVA